MKKIEERKRVEERCKSEKGESGKWKGTEKSRRYQNTYSPSTSPKRLQPTHAIIDRTVNLPIPHHLALMDGVDKSCGCFEVGVVFFDGGVAFFC